MVGIRASWKCALCPAIQQTYHLMRLGSNDCIEIPRGWSVVGNVSVCGEHSLGLRRADKARAHPLEESAQQRD